jgi:hypothetical protein
MEKAGLAVKGPVPSIGQCTRVYEILNQERGLTLEHDLQAAPEDRTPDLCGSEDVELCATAKRDAAGERCLQNAV